MVIIRRGQFGNLRDYFTRDLEDYREGFGEVDPRGEFWLGLDNMV